MSSRVASFRSGFTGRRQKQPLDGEHWRFEINFPPLSAEEMAAWRGWLGRMNVAEGTFLMGDNSARAPFGTGLGTPLVKGAGQLGKELVTDGWTPSQVAALKDGDYFQTGSGATARLFITTGDVVVDGLGVATIPVWPSLRNGVADDAPLTLVDPVGVFEMVDLDASWSYRPNVFQYGIKAIEVIE